MTYLVKHRRVSRRASAMGGAFDNALDWITGGFIASPQGFRDIVSRATGRYPTSEEMKCLDAANKEASGLDQYISNLARDWHPTGFYTPDELGQVVGQVLKITGAASSTVGSAPVGNEDAIRMRNEAINAIQRKAMQSLNYTQAAGEARAKGMRAVNAPGLKDWVLSAMLTASQALVTASVLDCNVPWLANAVLKFQALFDAVANIVKRIVGVALKFGELALDVIEEAPALAKTLITIAKYGVIGIAAVFVIRKIRETRG